MCDAASPFLHFAKMTGLVAGAEYYYSIDGGAACGATPPVLFKAPKAAGVAAGAYPFTMLAYADMGISNSQYTAAFLAQKVASQPVDVIIHAGDISYADNRGCPEYDVVQNDYYNEVSAYAAQVPVMYSSGNHEASSPKSKDGSFLAYRSRVAPTMPVKNLTASPFWYSFEVGRIHFLAFDIDQSWQSGSAQFEFIAADLAAVDRAATPLVVAFSHFPMLCSNAFWCNDGSGSAQAFRKLYEPLFNAPATRVHIFLNGHVHAAEINYPVATGSLVPSQTNFDGVETLLSMMLGFPGDTEVCCNDWQKPAPAYSAWRTDDVANDGGTFGFGEFIFTSDTAFELNVWSAVNRSVIFNTKVTLA